MPETPLKIFNSLSRRKEPFAPMAAPRVSVYSCGPTVYDAPHIGNYRFFVWVDILHRYLRWRGYDVTLVMNITDIDDKTIAGAQREGLDLRTFTDRHAAAFLEGLARLGVLPAAQYPRATEHVPEMIELVAALLERGHAYAVDGSVYFAVESFPEYGALARLDPDQMQSTERVEADEYAKRDPRDFTLWKAAKPDEPAWDSPFGPGRPGWHLECSAMSMKYLGSTFDLHLGGVDLMFPHHENEIAQSVCATGQPFARAWAHCSHLLVDGTKMSKSLGNFHTLHELLDDGHDPVAIRYLLSSVHYRRQLNFTFDALDQAAASVARLRELVSRIEQQLDSLPESDPDETLAGRLAEADRGFRAALSDDLNTAGALGCVFTLVREANTALDAGAAGSATGGAILDWLRDIDVILGVLPADENVLRLALEHAGRQWVAVGPPIDPVLQEQVLERIRARADRDFERADALRSALAAAGVEVEDTPEGARWRAGGR